MARVTVEDCIEKINNRFELIVAASQRAREISNGVPIEVERDNDKNPVVSLREIADGAIEPADLEERFIRTLQKINPVQNEDEENIEEEFSAYLSDSNQVSENLDKDTKIIQNNKIGEDQFEDVDQDIVKNEE